MWKPRANIHEGLAFSEIFIRKNREADLIAQNIQKIARKAPAKILIVDDEPQVRRALRTILATQGCAVIEVRTGEEALEEIKADPPDLVLLDINMPGVDGFETCRQIRESSDVPIIMVTVRDSENDKVQALDAGADDYLVKPFGTQELLARVRAAARRNPSLEELAPFVSPNLEIDFERRRVLARGQPVHLTPTEFELLKHLVLNQGKPVSHLKLLHLIWGPEHANDREPLRVFIGQLRRKIEPDPDHPLYILTEPLIGYRFEAYPEKPAKTRKHS
jgi:two-component system, OmpR family, KDP operon response regulator KdpE